MKSLSIESFSIIITFYSNILE